MLLNRRRKRKLLNKNNKEKNREISWRIVPGEYGQWVSVDKSFFKVVHEGSLFTSYVNLGGDYYAINHTSTNLVGKWEDEEDYNLYHRNPFSSIAFILNFL